MDKKYLIYGDIHNYCDEAEEVFSRYNDTHTIVMVGDYFDNFGDSPEVARNTARWLLKSLERPNRIHLFGNHDAAYMFSHNQAMSCPGFSPEKNKAIRSILKDEHFRQLKLYHVIHRGRDINPILISHAGISIPNLYGFKSPFLTKKGEQYHFLTKRTQDEHLETVAIETKKFFEAARGVAQHHFMHVGSAMGEPGQGGPYWLRLDAFTPIKNIDQIVGHTPTDGVRSAYFPNKRDSYATTFFIDAAHKEFVVIEDGVIQKRPRVLA